MPSYNHEKFVSDAIRSILAQSYANFELLIADDGSSDSTRERISEIRDERIRFFPNLENRGAGVVTRELIVQAKGKYIALLNSDDTWPEGKLALQVNFLEKNPEIHAHFGRARFIDSNSQEIPKGSLPFGSVFDKANRTRGMWLRYFFDDSNCIAHPTMMIRRECYDVLGVYDNRLRQLPDYKMWIEFVKRYNLHVYEKPLVNFRILPEESASAISRTNALRIINEHFVIARSFFDGVDRQLMIDAFGDRLQVSDIPTDIHLEIEKTLQFFVENRWLGIVYRAVGLERLYGHLGDPEFRGLLKADYKIDDRYFHKLMGEYDAFKPLANMEQFTSREVFEESRKRVLRYVKKKVVKSE